VTLTCAFIGRSAVHKRITMNDEAEIRAFIKPVVKTALPSKTVRRIPVKHCGKTICETEK
jgi:hypothetical protein